MYKITIEKVTETEYTEMESIYYDTAGKKYKDAYDCPSEGRRRKEEATGRMRLRTDKEIIYEQKLDDLDMKKLAIFLNQ